MSSSVEGNEVRKILAQFDAPAFVRRARGVKVADDLLHARLTGQREEWLVMPRTRLAQLHARLQGFGPLTQVGCPYALVTRLEELYCEWQPQLRSRVAPVRTVAETLPHWRRLGESFALFNRRWQAYVAKFNLVEINRIRDEYNKYYVVEKECATGSAVLARRGFVTLKLLTAESLLESYPLLPDLRAVGGGMA